MHILVIEPDQTTQSVLKGILSEFIVSTATTASDALNIIAGNAPGMIIMEPELPDIDGYQLCKELRSDERLKYTPILFMTNSLKLEDRLKAYDAGASDYLGKPFDVMEFLSKITGLSHFLSHRQQVQGGIVTQEILFGVQSAASRIQSISRFIQLTLIIHDFESLTYQFLRTAREIGLDCVLRVEMNEVQITRSTDDLVSKLEEEILDLARSVKRIHQFGKDRAISIGSMHHC
jgi:DNA-binding response OmpR family regulator